LVVFVAKRCFGLAFNLSLPILSYRPFLSELLRKFYLGIYLYLIVKDRIVIPTIQRFTLGLRNNLGLLGLAPVRQFTGSRKTMRFMRNPVYLLAMG